MRYQWDRIVGSIVWGRSRAAMVFGLPLDELMQVGRVAAFKAERSWRPDGGRTMPNWVYYQVEMNVRNALVDAGRFAAEDDLPEPDGEDGSDDETRFLVREALIYLEAKLPREDWVLLWMHHGEGCNCREMAKKWGIGHAAMRKRISRARNRAVTLWREAA